MPSRVENLMTPNAAKSASSSKRSSLMFDFGAADRRPAETNFADSLKRARQPEVKPEPKSEVSPAETKTKVSKSKSDRAEREDAVEEPDTGEPAESTEHVLEAASQSVETSGENETDIAESNDSEDDGEQAGVVASNEPVVLTEAATTVVAAQPIVAVGAESENEVIDGPVDAPGDDAVARRPTVQAADAAKKTQITSENSTTDADTDADADADGIQRSALALGLDGESLDGETEGETQREGKAGLPAAAVASVKPKSAPEPDEPAEETSTPAPTATEDKRPMPKPVNPDRPAASAGTADEPALPAENSALETLFTKVSTTVEGEVESDVPLAPTTAARSTPATPATPAAPAPQPRLQQFAETNHDNIVTSLRTQALAKGGTMEIRLDPPELGALQVSVKMSDGVITASFQTSNDEATRLLSHSLSQLKHALEASGISVDKLQVQQSPRSDHDGNAGDGRNSQQHEDASARQEQQRKEMIKRMWAKLAGTEEPLDLVA